MNPHFLIFLAFDTMAERARDAEVHHRLVRYDDGFSVEPATPGLARRSLARAAASVSRGSAALARRLDERTVEADSSFGSSSLA
jgi:hypothetical protein